MKRLLLLVVTITLAGCARPGDHPISPNCVWIEEDSRPLNLAKIADRRHLRYDAETAEDVAIRWADQHFNLLPEWEQRHNECMQALFNGIARHHSVDVALVREYRLQRDIVVDTPVIIGYGLIYAFVAYIFAGRIRRRFPAGEPGFWVMTLVMAIGISLIGVMIGGFLYIIIENFRVNSAHLSYRMNRIPLRQHWVVAFVCGFMIFGLVTLIRSRVGTSNAKWDEGTDRAIGIADTFQRNWKCF